MTATRGPIPKPSNRRLGHTDSTDEPVTQVEIVAVEPPYEAEPAWQDYIQRLWNNLGRGAMAQYYQPTDWDQAFITLTILDYVICNPNPQTMQVNAAAISSCMSDLARLGVTEGDRRRLRIEAKPIGMPTLDPKIAILAEYRQIAAEGKTS